MATALAWMRAGRKVALATVISTWGSAPRPKGSLLAVRDDGLFEGSVSGGCIEGAVVIEALEALKNLKPKTLTFGVSNEQAWSAGLACGGEISVLVEPAGEEKRAALQTLFAHLQKGEAVAFATHVASGDSLVLTEDDEGPLAAAAAMALAAESPAAAEIGGKTYFINMFPPPRRLYLVGAVHIAKELIPLAAAAGYAVTVIDPRGAFADKERFANVRVLEDWPDDVLAKEKPDPRTAIVTLTHDPKLDDAALKVALRSPAFYIGSLGSGKTHAARKARLAKLGFSDEEIARVHGPVGLGIGAATPFEIALSILAEITAVRRLRPDTGT
ncbi:MAG TPA: XdhC family protein [Sphingomonadales bacterium]|nr:XdhC family protein [Sphingomonadales bacterium]